MEMLKKDKSNNDVQESSLSEKYSKLFDQLERCNEDEQRKKIEEMNEVIDEMDEEEFESMFTPVLLNKMHKMFVEKKLLMNDALVLLKHFGYYRVLKFSHVYGIEEASFYERFEEMIIDEEMKKKEKDEKLLVDLFECYLLLNNRFNSILFSICVPCLMKVALKKEGNEETQKEVEMALLALSNVLYLDMGQELNLNDIKEIIQYQQEHHNLTRLAYQSVWQFLIYRFFNDKRLEDAIANELHLAREAKKEMEELMIYVDWKRTEEEREKETKEELILLRWLEVLNLYFSKCRLRNEEFVGLVGSIVRVFRAARDNYKEISNQCVYSLKKAAESRAGKIDDLLKSGSIDAVLDEIQQQTMNDRIVSDLLSFFMVVLWKLEEKEKDEKEKAKRKELKRKVFEKMEEEGYEDIIIWLGHYIYCSAFGDFQLIKNCFDYFVFL
ncbi:uncharacterized protein MONOS_8807 [Monocercomonoides exilis]|uniref:uncharacterized protein n=1 Tax=Monocercomonoides exilis TaxID=2049356 RepID=UPI00355A800A|nr:hypothetical protein MONOS_8807 [Monocercomonoides exilis]|eukprot:MONOS_8807.1-p1 / transcript=MONOS_8807.1 / gene=MONOS_8807 / organism=Monocercomonoides_exilis_PA203 / gene_product=unspecified product / transcript_product=unspecified product / location=Mono_scaffold00343:4403-5844(+) / protein_length=440 / sequence_SO=supercontig / SO=protein_coding / is_pseudo=false